jgi:hypothetical protein
MTSQATNRKKGGLTSCGSRSGKFRVFTYRELETMRVVINCLVRRLLLLARGVPGHEVGVEGVKRGN